MSTVVVNHQLFDAMGHPLEYGRVLVDLGGVVNGTWQPVSGFLSTGELITTGSILTAPDGTYSLDLTPNSEINPTGTTYRVTHPTGEQLFISVPEGGPFELLSLLTSEPPQPAPVSVVATVTPADSTLVAGGTPTAPTLRVNETVIATTAYTGSTYVAHAAASTGVAATDTLTLQTAMNELPAGGGKVLLQPGVYRIDATLTAAVPNTILQGAGKDATIIQTTSAIRMIDSNGLDGLDLRDLQVDGTGTATSLVRMFKTSSIAQQMRMEHVRLLNAASGGTLLDTSGGTGASIADCYFYDVEFNGGGIGITVGDLDNQLYSCRFSNLTTAGIQFMTGKSPGVHCYGTIFSGNGTDLQLNGSPGSISFHGCWFENSTNNIISLGSAVAATFQVDLQSCLIHTFGTNLFDLTNASQGAIVVNNGSLTPANGHQVLLPANCTACFRMMTNGQLVTLSGAGNLLSESSPATSPNTGFTVNSTINTGVVVAGSLLRSGGPLQAGNGLVALTTGSNAGAGNPGSTATISVGTGSPANASGTDGDLYFNTAGGSLTTIYQRRAGVWVGIV